MVVGPVAATAAVATPTTGARPQRAAPRPNAAVRPPPPRRDSATGVALAPTSLTPPAAPTAPTSPYGITIHVDAEVLQWLEAKGWSSRFSEAALFNSRGGWRSTPTDSAARNLQSIQQHDRVHG